MALKEFQDANWDELSITKKAKVVEDYLDSSVDSRGHKCLEAASIRFLYGEHNIRKYLKSFIHEQNNKRCQNWR